MDSPRAILTGSTLALIRTSVDHEVVGYSLLVGAISCGLALPLWSIMYFADISVVVAVILALAILVAFSDSAWDIAAELSPLLRRAEPLEQRDLSRGIPEDCRTLVVIPILLYPRSNIEQIVADLEARYLANRETNLYFCLLTDFADADHQTLPEDGPCLERAIRGIKRLNERHGEIFLLLHRERTWSSRDRIWMGKERKRGKLAALNEFLVCASRDTFSIAIGSIEHLSSIRYVITLDADSPLPAGSALSLIATISHPGNHPVVDDTFNIVVKGHGIIQPMPRVVADLPGASWLQRLVRSSSTLGSDLYQQLYGEGSYYGKGIYDVRTFHEVLGHRFPENLVLSHDLLEGAYLRSAITYEAVLPEEHPRTYLAEARRRHRWTRGDWQTYPWLFNTVGTENGDREPNPISILSRWKVFDNIRRTLVPTSFLVVLIAGWMLQLGNEWTGLAVAALFAPIVTQVIGSLVRNDSSDTDLGAILRALIKRTIWICYLPYESANTVDAILRSIWRMKVSRVRLLEWIPSGEFQIERVSLTQYIRQMWISPVLAIGSFFLLRNTYPPPLLMSLTMLLWAVSPAVAWCLDRRQAPGVPT